MSNIHFLGYTGLFLSFIESSAVRSLVFEEGLTPDFRNLKGESAEFTLQLEVQGPNRARRSFRCAWEKELNTCRFYEWRGRKGVKPMSEEGWRIEILSSLNLEGWYYRKPNTQSNEAYIRENIDELITNKFNVSD